MTVQGPVKEQQPDGMSHGGLGGSGGERNVCLPKIGLNFAVWFSPLTVPLGLARPTPPPPPLGVTERRVFRGADGITIELRQSGTRALVI